MLSKFRQRLRLLFERIIMRGPLAQLGLVAVLLLLIALIAGLVMWRIDPEFESLGEALWWAFQHVLVPEFIDGDDNLARRTVGTILLIVCSILFVGGVVAILVQWLTAASEQLELGLTPITQKGHTVLLAWTSRTPMIARSIALSRDLPDNANRAVSGRNKLAILASRADSNLMRQLESFIGEKWRNDQIILRTGSTMNADDIQRVNVNEARAVVLPTADSGASSSLDSDTKTLKSLMSLDATLETVHADAKPLVVVELKSPVHRPTLRRIYQGPMEVIVSKEIVAKIIVQTIRYPGLSHVYSKLFTDADDIDHFTLEDPKLLGLSAGQLMGAFSDDIVLGFIKQAGDTFEAELNPPADMRLEAGERLAVLGARPANVNLGEVTELDDRGGGPAIHANPQKIERRVLILGWNSRVPLVLRELCEFRGETYSIDVVSVVPERKREAQIRAESVSVERITVRHEELDFTDPGQMARVDLTGYDNVVFFPSERLDSRAEADARSILGYVVVRDLLRPGKSRPSILLELADASNAPLFAHREGEILVAPSIVSHLLARVSLHRELRAVFDELFGSAGSEIRFRPISDLDLEGDATFSKLQHAARANSETAIGVRRPGQIDMPTGGVELNPGRDDVFNPDDDVIVISQTPLVS